MSEGPDKVKKGWRALRLFLAGVFLLLGSIYPLSVPMVEAVGRILGGFVIHMTSTAWPALAGNSRDLLFPLFCLAASVGIGHRIFGWLAAHGSKSWEMGQTLCVFALLLLGSASAVAMSGVVHQLAWLGNSRWTQSKPSREWMHQRHTLRQIAFAITEYVEEYGQYPETLGQVAGLKAIAGTYGLFVPTDSAGPMEPVHYRKPTGTSVSEWMLVGSAFDDKILVALVDGSVRAISQQELEAQITKITERGAHEY